MANRQTIVGAFVLGGIVLALAVIVIFGQFNPLAKPVRAVVIFQGSAGGLSIGSPVTFRGVRVGSVSDIAIAFDRRVYAAYIPVTLELLPDRVIRVHNTAPVAIQELIRHGLRAEVNIQSLVTGQSQIDLDFDPSVAAILHPGYSNLPEIPVRQSAIQRAQQTLSQLPLQELANNANLSMESIRALADKLDHDMPTLIASIQQTSDHSREMVDVATRTISALQAELTTTLDGIDRLTTAGIAQMDERGADLHQLLINTNTTVLQARQTLVDLRAVTSPRSDERADLAATLRDLSASAAALRGFASDIERNPQLLLLGRQP